MLSLVTWPVLKQDAILDENNKQTGLRRRSKMMLTDFGKLFVSVCIPNEGFRPEAPIGLAKCSPFTMRHRPESDRLNYCAVPFADLDPVRDEDFRSGKPRQPSEPPRGHEGSGDWPI